MGWHWKAVRAVWALGLFLILGFSYLGSEIRVECVYSCFLDWLPPRLLVNLHCHRRNESRICHSQAFEETNKKHLPELLGRYELFAKCKVHSFAGKWIEWSRPPFWLQSHCLWVFFAHMLSVGNHPEGQRGLSGAPSADLFSLIARGLLAVQWHIHGLSSHSTIQWHEKMICLSFSVLGQLSYA